MSATISLWMSWRCPWCGASVRDCDLTPGVHVPVLDPPVHIHAGRRVDLVMEPSE